MSSYKDLNVWKLSFELVKLSYQLTRSLPESEKFGLSSQLQRSAVSIPSNIAEGQQRSSGKEFVNFLSIARGSAAELYTQILIARDVYGIECGQLLLKTEDIQKMLFSLQSSIKNKSL